MMSYDMSIFLVNTIFFPKKGRGWVGWEEGKASAGYRAHELKCCAFKGNLPQPKSLGDKGSVQLDHWRESPLDNITAIHSQLAKAKHIWYKHNELVTIQPFLKIATCRKLASEFQGQGSGYTILPGHSQWSRIKVTCSSVAPQMPHCPAPDGFSFLPPHPYPCTTITMGNCA